MRGPNIKIEIFVGYKTDSSNKKMFCSYNTIPNQRTIIKRMRNKFTIFNIFGLDLVNPHVVMVDKNLPPKLGDKR